MKALVVPTIRENSIRGFLTEWGRNDDWKIIIVEDNPQKSFDVKDVDYHFSWNEIKEELGDDAWIISHRDSAIRSFGFLMAYKMGAEHIFTLDDDCHPADPFISGHLNAINNVTRWTESVPGQRTRGIPYKNLGNSNIVLNVGLWTGVPDFDAIQSLGGAEWSGLDHVTESRIIPNGQYFPMCGMNMCFKREIAPLMYFPLMGEGYDYRRFDDIWCGIIVKKVCDHLRLNITCEKPYVYHTKESDPFVNLVKEAPGVVANEDFWEIIDRIPLHGNTPIECAIEISQSLQLLDGKNYLQKLGKALGVWANLFANYSFFEYPPKAKL